MLGFYAYLQAALGPLMPFLREELSLNYTLAGLHFSAFAFGMMMAGTTGERVVGWLGRKQLFWFSGLGMSLAGLLLTFGRSSFVTILASFLMGFIGTYLVVMVQALLSDEFGEQRAVALTESNVSASIFALIAPLVIGFSTTINLDWRLALWLGGLIWIGAYITRSKVPIPPSKNKIHEQADKSKVSLPSTFTLYRLIIFVGVSIEWCMVFWAADFLINVVNIGADLASILMSFFFGAVIIGRLLGSRLTRHFRTLSLLLVASLVILLGFPLFWLSNSLTWHVIGLFIVGLGIANLFPLGLAAASDVGADDVDRASARIAQAAGLAILIAPQILGILADSWGIFRAYAVLPVLLFALIAMIIFALYLDRKQEIGQKFSL